VLARAAHLDELLLGHAATRPDPTPQTHRPAAPRRHPESANGARTAENSGRKALLTFRIVNV